MSITLLTLSLLFVSTQALDEKEYEPESTFKVIPLNCFVSDTNEPSLMDFYVSFSDKRLKEYERVNREKYSIIERGSVIPVDHEVNLLVYELDGIKNAMIYNPDNKDEHVILSALEDEADVGIEQGTTGFFMFWYNYNSNNTLKSPINLQPNEFLYFYKKKFKGTPVKILEFRKSEESFNKSVIDVKNLVKNRDDFFVEISCDLTILDASVYVDPNEFMKSENIL